MATPPSPAIQSDDFGMLRETTPTTRNTDEVERVMAQRPEQPACGDRARQWQWLRFGRAAVRESRDVRMEHRRDRDPRSRDRERGLADGSCRQLAP